MGERGRENLRFTKENFDPFTLLSYLSRYTPSVTSEAYDEEPRYGIARSASTRECLMTHLMTRLITRLMTRTRNEKGSSLNDWPYIYGEAFGNLTARP